MESKFEDLQLHREETSGAGQSQAAHEDVSEEMYTEEDEEYAEYPSEDDERPTRDDFRQYGMYQSLPVPSGPPDMEADCDNVEEYLRRVRYEAEHLPQTVTSQIDPREYDAQRTDYVPVQDDETERTLDCMPSLQWLQEFLADFAALRAQLHKDEEIDPFLPQPPLPPPPHPLPHSRDENGWHWYCLGRQSSQADANVGFPADSADTAAMQTDPPVTYASQAAALQEAAKGSTSAEDSHNAAVQADSAEAHEHQTHAIQADQPDTRPAQSSTQESVAQPFQSPSLRTGATTEHSGLLSANSPKRLAECDAHTELADPYAQHGHPDAHQADHGTDPDQQMETAADSVTGITQPGHVIEDESAANPGNAPQMAVLASLDQITVNSLLQWHVKWALSQTHFNELALRWLYALLAQVDKPIMLESSSRLRQLLRHCLKLRRQISDGNSVDLLPLHMLMALTGGYFGQDGSLSCWMQPSWV